MSCTYRFMNSSLSQLSHDRAYDIILRQQPERAKLSVPNERDKRFLEPPPILQMKWMNCSAEEEKTSLQSPFYFMMVNILHADSNEILPSNEYFLGSTVSSLYRLRDVDNTDGGFFVFGDLAIRKRGHFKLHFSLFELIDGVVENRKTVYSRDFKVYTSKEYPGPIESTFLSRTFSDQGIKMRVRKEHKTHLIRTNDQKRTNTRKRKYQEPILSSPPSYASDNAHFGRWQSFPHKTNSSKLTQQHTKPEASPSLPSPPPSVASCSPTLMHLPPIQTSMSLPTIYPPYELQSKWTSTNDHYDGSHLSNRLPPLQEIMNNKYASESYNPPLFPIDNSFFRRT